MSYKKYNIGEYGERPWGWWRVDEIGDGFVRKTIQVNPGCALSLQSHKYRMENWKILEGSAEVIVDGDTYQLVKGGEVVIPLGAKHRLKNNGSSVLLVSEIQRGEILDENDIIRYEDIYGREKKIFIADMDGTLTPARLPMTDKFSQFFSLFLDKYKFYVVSGSDYKKVQEQLPQNIIQKLECIYCSMGNEAHANGKLIYKNVFTPEETLIEKLELYRANTKYPGRLFNNYIEIRTGMINFSPIGRDCSVEERIAYKKWDDVHLERKQIAEELQIAYPKYDISIGGNISIDIVPHGFGKEQVASKIRELHPYEKIFFIGDRTEQGGNDYSLAQELLKIGNAEIIHVNGPDDTLIFLENHFE